MNPWWSMVALVMAYPALKLLWFWSIGAWPP